MTEALPLGFVPPTRLSGDEPVVGPDGSVVARLLEFWAWSASDLLSNIKRGVIAEYLVALRFGQAAAVRMPWDVYDVKTPAGTAIEVKSASFIQQWGQRAYSLIAFQIPETTAWDPYTNKFAGERRRQADVYVFALLAHKDQETINPLDTRQWTFFIIATNVLDAGCRRQKTIGLASLRRMGAREVSWQDIPRAVSEIARETRAINVHDHGPVNGPQNLS